MPGIARRLALRMPSIFGLSSPSRSTATRAAVAPRGAVLIVRTHRVQWVEVGPKGECAGTAAVEGSTVLDLVKSAVQARRSAGSRLRHCRVALGDELITERVLPLPPLPRKDLPAVLERKAAGLLSREASDVTYSARRWDGTVQVVAEETSLEHDPKGPLVDAQVPWLLCAASRSLVRDLRLALAREGIRVQEVVSLRLANMSWMHESARLTKLAQASAESDAPDAAHANRGPREGVAGTLTVDVDESGVCVGLFEGDSLRHLSFLRGELSQSAALATNLMQELRSVEAWWRKQSRGSKLESVLCMGLDPGRAALFSHALTATFPGAEVVCHSVSEIDADGTPQHSNTRWAALARGPFPLDVGVPIPLRHSHAMLVTMSILVAGALCGFVIQHRVAEQTRLATDETQELTSAACDLPGLVESNQRCAQAAGDLRKEVLRLEALHKAGLPAYLVFNDCVQALAGEIDLLRLDLSADGLLDMECRADAEPLASIRTLESARSSLESSSLLENLELAPPVLERLQDGQGGVRESLLVRFSGQWSPLP